MITYTPIYNEMPWTPYFLRHLLEFDCPINIGEGASDFYYNNSCRSTDGSWELINLFAARWNDRVTLYLHDYSLNLHGPIRKTRMRPRGQVRMDIWEKAKHGEWIIGLSPDNFYTKTGIKKIKKACNNAENDKYLLMTDMRVFNFNFKTVLKMSVHPLIGSWTILWPCIWRKNNEYQLYIDSELLKHHKTKETLSPVKMQQQDLSKEFNHIILRTDIHQFHYKNVKKRSNRLQRFDSDQVADEYMYFPINDERFIKYYGKHPSILDNHPWRHTRDCRKESSEFNWEEFVDIVIKP